MILPKRVSLFAGFAVLMAIFLLMGGCRKAEFIVDVQLDGGVNQTFPMLYYASDKEKGWNVDDVVEVHGGKGKLLGRTVKPTLVYIFAGGSRPQAVFYAERGDKIEIRGKGALPLTWEISGNKISEQLSKFRIANQDAIRGENVKALNAAVAAFVKREPGNPVSTLLLCIYYNRGEDETGFRNAWKLLEGDAAEPEWAALVARGDMLVGAPQYTGKPEDIVVASYGTGCDTLRIASKPSLIYFSLPSSDMHGEDIQRLRDLTKEFPDSSRRIIAEISAEPDSMRRVWDVKSDSLRKAVRGWMPLGLSDPAARQAGVKGLPYVIVTDGRGRRIYAGYDLLSAEQAFRKAVK